MSQSEFPAAQVAGSGPARTAKVCIVTRTKNRRLMLGRAGESVRAQTYQDYVWVVVNDGGDEAEARATVEASGVAPERRVFISNPRSLGMEAASNIGIRAVGSDYIVIHDDDDSWEPEFLATCVAFLEGPDGGHYGGVVTHSTYVSEFVREDEIVRLAEKPYQTKLTSIDLDAVVDRNLFPPISFLFRRSVYEQVGGFDESLPVLGDWRFNMEFLLRANIGVIPERLALYHHRDSAEHTAPDYRNTVVDGVALHQRYTPLVRNDFLRKNVGQSAIAFRMAVSGAGNASELAGSAQSRAAHQALPSVQLLARGDSDLPWTISAINAKLADRRLKSFYKLRKVQPLPPNATWSVVLPMLQRLELDVPIPADFDDNAYLRTYPDVADAVRRGEQQSGFMHYLLHGRHEGRTRTSGELRPVVDRGPGFGAEDNSSRVRPVFDSPLMQRQAHRADGFETVLHVAHHEWHGIRQASAYSPGHKLLIPAHELIDNADKRMIADEIARRGITRICVQGYSDNADALVLFLRSALGPDTRFYVISHVNTAQFDHRFEMQVISRLLSRRRFGVLDGVASVKPNFGQLFEGFWSGTIINYAPNIPLVSGRRAEQIEVYAPLDVGWRKNLYTNLIAASEASSVDVVKTANFPSGLEDVYDLAKLRLVGYLRGRDLLDEMARSTLTLVATLAECQPMTQLESLAVGTPSMTGPLDVAEFADDPLMELCTTHHLDNPTLLARDIERVIERTVKEPAGIQQMIGEHLTRRHALATQSYADFLEL